MNDKLRYQFEYRRNLPHIQPPGATFFITTRLAGSLPAAILQNLQREAETARERLQVIPDEEQRAAERYRQQRQAFARWDQALDDASTGPTWLKRPAVAQLVADSLHYRDGRVYRLDAYCIMPNHLHLVMRPSKRSDGTFYALSKIMHSLKGYTAYKVNELLGRSGSFWQSESYDHIVRDRAEWQRIVKYVVMNPVKAGLIHEWEDWPWSYYNPDIL